MRPVEAAQTPESAPGASHHSGLPGCPGSGSPAVVDGWQSLPTRVPTLAHEPGVLLSYKTSFLIKPHPQKPISGQRLYLQVMLLPKFIYFHMMTLKTSHIRLSYAGCACSGTHVITPRGGCPGRLMDLSPQGPASNGVSTFFWRKASQIVQVPTPSESASSVVMA